MSKKVMEVSYIIADAVKKLTETQPTIVEATNSSEKISVSSSNKKPPKKKKK